MLAKKTIHIFQDHGPGTAVRSCTPSASPWSICGQRYAGFTLIELMVVMLLITIVLAVAVPRFESGMLQDPTKKASRWLTNTLRSLRSQAFEQQKTVSLVIDLSENRLWTIEDTMDEPALAEAAENAYVLPEAFTLVDVQFPHRDRVTSGLAYIQFYPAGYSDQALIHAKDDSAQRYTFLIEPLLPKIKRVDDWITY